MKSNKPIGYLLVANGFITEVQLERALEVQKKMPGKRIGDILMELSYVTEKNMLECLSQRVNAPFIDIKSYRIDSRAVNAITSSVAKKYNVIPIDFKNNLLLVATNDPLDFYAMDEISAVSGYEASPVIALKGDIAEAVEKYYDGNSYQDAIENINREYQSSYDEDDDIAENASIEGAPVVKLVNSIISQAYSRGASDIHIEPFKRSMVIRIRIDGELIHHATMNIGLHNSIATRIKILSGMNIAEKRVPQDGNFTFKNEDIKTDVRASTMPTIHGEKLVLRLLNNGGRDFLMTINELGMNKRDIEKINRMMKIPNGIIFVTGPTGSGKTTTLYAVLNELVSRNVNIITVEDPVEMPIEGVNQVRVNPKAGLTFSSALRSILRQDPDIIMIGEIRDGETASIGVRAAITGHLVLATLHTNDSASAIVRIVDMGVESYLAGAAVSGIIAQRLVKILCPHCKREYEPIEAENKLLGAGRGAVKRLCAPVGCDKCSYTGYKGRTAIYEIFEADAGARELISKNATVAQMKEYSAKKGTEFLKDRIIEMAVNGETSIDEVEKIIYSID